MKEIKVFIASSGSLREEREAIELDLGRKNDHLKDQLVYIKLQLWEKESKAFSSKRKQLEFNQLAVSSDIFICIIYDRVGEFTYEEFKNALENFIQHNTPKTILLYFKDKPIRPSDISDDYISVQKLKEEIKALGQIWETFESTDTLKYKISEEINSFIRRLNFEDQKREDLYKVTFIHDLLIINDKNSSNVFYRKYSIIQAKREIDFTKDEFYADGVIDVNSIQVNRGWIEKIEQRFSRVFLQTKLDRVLHINEHYPNEFSVTIKNLFPQESEFWQVELLSDTPIIKSTVVFPKQRCYSTFFGKMIKDYQELNFENVKEIKFNGMRALDLEAYNTKKGEKYQICWSW